jgi:hypothetical protein
MSEDTRRYCSPFASDPSLGLKIGRFLDNVFQNFCTDSFVFDRDPIWAAHRGLVYQFQDQVNNFFNKVRTGIVPEILLPQSLMSKGQKATNENGGCAGSKAAKGTKTKGRPEPNPEAKEEWNIPAGKKFGDYFSPTCNKL